MEPSPVHRLCFRAQYHGEADAEHTRAAVLQLNTNKNSRLPDLNASVGENISFGRGLTAQNTYEDRTTSSTSFSLGTTVSLFDGNKTTHNIRLSKLNLDAADADLSKARNDLSMNVAKAYIEALNNMR